MLSDVHGSIIDRGVGSHGYGKYVVDGINVTNRRHLLMWMKTVQLPNAATKKYPNGNSHINRKCIH